MEKLEKQKKINLYIISDSVGGTANNLGQAAMSQFPGVDANVSAYPFIRGEDTLYSILEKAHKDNALVIHTLISPTLTNLIVSYCKDHDLFCFDVINPVVKEIEQRTNTKPLEEPGILHQLNDNYFDRISAIEFAVKYDDGRDPKGFLEADIVLLGISRTSKTPLSMFLANQNYKVANLPLVPEAHIPETLWKVNPKKIVGLTNDRHVLNSIRRERMIAYGLNPETGYSKIDRIDEELVFAKKLYDKLDCLVINVATKSIEETAAIIVNTLQLDSKKRTF